MTDVSPCFLEQWPTPDGCRRRTDDAHRVQDILTALAWLKRQPGVREVSSSGVTLVGHSLVLLAFSVRGEDERTATEARARTRGR